MSIIVLNSVLLGLVTYLLIKTTFNYLRFKKMYGEYATYGIPSVKQMQRYSKIKKLESRILWIAVAFVVSLLLIIIQFIQL